MLRLHVNDCVRWGDTGDLGCEPDYWWHSGRCPGATRAVRAGRFVGRVSVDWCDLRRSARGPRGRACNA